MDGTLRPNFLCETVLASKSQRGLRISRDWQVQDRLGMIDEAIPLMEQAIRLSPRDPYLGNYYFRIGEAHLLRSRPAIGAL
jgi:hypothetical protein